MRTLMRVALALVVAVAAMIGAAAWLLPRWVESDGFRALLASAARDATGRDVAWDSLRVALFPPRVVAKGVRIGDAEAPLLAAERVDLRIALAPLLTRVVHVDAATLDGVTWRVVRDANGIALPFADATSAAALAPTPASASATSTARGPSLQLAIHQVELSNSRVLWEDRAVAPPVSIELRDVAGSATGSGAGAPVGVSLAGTFASGGTLRIERDPALAGTRDLEATLEGVDLAPFAPYFGRNFGLAGHVGGTIQARGPAAALEALEAQLELADASVRAGDVAAQGPVALTAKLHGAAAQPEGEFQLDATRAQLSAYGGAFKKPPGAPATATGRLVHEASGKLGVDDVRVSIKNMNGALHFEPGGVRFDAAPFDLAGWGDVIPALAALAPEGPIAFDGVRVATDPAFALGGRVALDGVRVRPPAGCAAPGPPRHQACGPIALRGALVGAGAGFQSDGLVATVGGQPISLAVRVEVANTELRHRVRLAAKNVDARALLEALTGDPDLLEGPLTIDADLAGPLGANAVAGIAGSADLAVGAGRIPRVSPLRAALDGLRRRSETAGLFDLGSAEQALAPYLGDRFESIAGDFTVGGGRARTQALVLRYPGYRLELRGSVGLADASLDGAGRVAFGDALFAALAGRPAQSGGGERVIEVARVHGTVNEPKLEIDRAGAVAFAASFALAQRRDKLERKLDERLGEGSGGKLLDALDALLGKKEKR